MSNHRMIVIDLLAAQNSARLCLELCSVKGLIMHQHVHVQQTVVNNLLLLAHL